MRKLAFRALAVLAFLGVQLLALELVLWAFFSFHQDYDAEMWRYTRLLKRNVPDARGHVHAVSGSAKLMGVEVRTNSLGLRGPEVGELGSRLLVAGDSFTLGWGVKEEEAYPAVIGAACGGLKPVNMGVGNYNLEQVVAGVKDLGSRLQARQLLYGFYWNDAEPLQREPDSWIARHSHLALFWRKIQVRLLHYGGKAQSYRDYYGATFEGESWKRFEGAARELAAYARKNNVELRVALLPELRVPNDPDIGAIYAKVETLFRGLGARTVNLFGKLPPLASPELYWVAPDDPHPNTAAHAWIAREIQKSFWPNCNGL